MTLLQCVYEYARSLSCFAAICCDMHVSLQNPFRKPVSDRWELHIPCVLFSLSLSLLVYFVAGYYYRQDYQICWNKNSAHHISVCNDTASIDLPVVSPPSHNVPL